MSEVKTAAAEQEKTIISDRQFALLVGSGVWIGIGLASVIGGEGTERLNEALTVLGLIAAGHISLKKYLSNKASKLAGKEAK